jgi:hypothetical protein
MFNNLTPADKKTLSQISESTTLSFSDKVTMLELDPKNDFQYSDLRKVNFSNSNLCGFNFTGSNLTGSIGNNIQFDDTTILIDCELQDSPFLLSKLCKAILDNPDWYKRYSRLINADVIEKALYVSEAGSIETTNEKRRQIASMLIHNSDDGFLQKVGLTTVFKLTKSKLTDLAYMKSVLAQRQENSHIIASTVKNLGILYKKNEDVFQIFLSILQDKRVNVALENMRAINRSTFRYKYRSDIAKYTTSDEWLAIRKKINKLNLKDERLIIINNYGGFLEYEHWLPDPAERIDTQILDNCYPIYWTHMNKYNNKHLKELMTLNERVRRERVRSFFRKIYLSSNIRFYFTIEARRKYETSEIYHTRPNKSTLDLNPYSVPDFFNEVLEPQSRDFRRLA